jgi:hypothetical protein
MIVVASLVAALTGNQNFASSNPTLATVSASLAAFQTALALRVIICKAYRPPIRPDDFATRPDRVAFVAECAEIEGDWLMISEECSAIILDQFATRGSRGPIRADRSAIRLYRLAIHAYCFAIRASIFLIHPSRCSIHASNFVITAAHSLIASRRPAISADKFTLQSDRFALCMNGSCSRQATRRSTCQVVLSILQIAPSQAQSPISVQSSCCLIAQFHRARRR